MSKVIAEKDCMNSKEIIQLIPELLLPDLLKLKFQEGDKWVPAFEYNNPHKRLVSCNICPGVKCQENSLISHVNGKKHIVFVNSITKFYHPCFNKSHLKNNSKPVANASSKSAVKTASKPAVNSASKPAAKSGAKPAVNTASKPAVNAASKPVVNTASKPAVNAASKPVVNAASKHSDNAASKAVINSDKKSVVNASSKRAVNAASKPVVNASSKPAVNAVSKPAEKPIIDISSDPAVDEAPKPAVIILTKPVINLVSKKAVTASPKSADNEVSETVDDEVLESVKNEVSELVDNEESESVNNASPKSAVNEVLDSVEMAAPANDVAQESVTEMDDDITEVIVIEDDAEDTTENSISEKSAKESDKNTVDLTETSSAPKEQRTRKIQDSSKSTSNSTNSSNEQPIEILRPNPLRSRLNEKTPQVGSAKKRPTEKVIQPNTPREQRPTTNVKATQPQPIKEQRPLVRVIPTSALREQSHVRSENKNLNKVDDDVFGFLGVEYVIKIRDHPRSPFPKYECGLCEVAADPSFMQSHLLGLNHKLKFCEKHFPTAIRQYRQYTSEIPESEQYKILIPILDKLSIAIEKHHGLSSPYTCSFTEYSAERSEIFSKIFSRRHSSEQTGPTFAHVINSKEVDEMLAFNETYKPKQPQKIIFDRGLPEKDRDLKLYSNPQRPLFPPISLPSNAPLPTTAPLPTPTPMPMSTSMPMVRENDRPLNDEVHKRMVNEFLRNTRQNREPNFDNRHDLKRRHPYDRPREDLRFTIEAAKRQRLNEERREAPKDVWQIYAELIDKKLKELDRTYDRYFNKPESHPMYDTEWQAFWQKRKQELKSLGADYRNFDYQPEWVRHFKKRLPELYDEEKNGIEIECRQKLSLPILQSLPESKSYQREAPQKPISPKPRVSAVERPRATNLCHAEITTKVIAALRLLTAFEENLGSLGSKAIELLSKAVQVEKLDPKKIVHVLSEENQSFFHTAKEKLKSILFAGFLKGPKERAMHKAVQEVEGLLDTIKTLPLSREIASLEATARLVPKSTDKPVSSTSLDLSKLSNINIDSNLLGKLMELQQTVRNQNQSAIPISNARQLANNFPQNHPQGRPTQVQIPAMRNQLPAPSNYSQPMNNFNPRFQQNNPTMNQPYQRHPGPYNSMPMNTVSYPNPGPASTPSWPVNNNFNQVTYPQNYYYQNNQY